MQLIQLGLMHGGIWPEDDDEDDDNYRNAAAPSSESTLKKTEAANQLPPLPRRIRDLVERRRRDRDSETIRPQSE